MSDFYKNLVESLRESSRLLDSHKTIVNFHGLLKDQCSTLMYNAATAIEALIMEKRNQKSTVILHQCEPRCFFYDKVISACAIHNTRQFCEDYKETFEPRIVRVKDSNGVFVDFLVQNERQLKLLDELKLYKLKQEQEC